jgi:hypothetical protein
MDIERLQKIMESCHVNFLIGSGASRNYLDTLWNIETLLTALEAEKDHDSEAFKILETSIRYWYFNKCMRGNLKLCNDGFIVSDDEQKEYDLTIIRYENFIKALNLILLKRKTSLLSKQVNLFTTNMDIFLDKVLDNVGVEFNDGFSGKFEPTFKTSNYQKTVYKSSAHYDLSSELPLFNLFKLHGSLTWCKVNHDRITYDSKLQALSSLDKINFEDSALVDLINTKGEYKDFATLKTECESKSIADDKKFKSFKTEYEKLVMINPTKEKFENTTLRLEYYEQMRMFSNILEKENSVLFVTGFSFADEHIRQITSRALNSNPTLLVCVFCYDQKEKTNIDKLFPVLKFNNLYTDFIDYSFQRTTNEIFVGIANNLDASFYEQLIEQLPTINQPESTKDGEEAK